MSEHASLHEVPADAPAWAVALQESPLGEAMRQSLYLYPTVETLHIFGFVALVGTILALDLRLIGVFRELPVARLAGLLLPVSVGGFVLALSMGGLLFATEAASLIGNGAFRLKGLLILLAGVNAATLHAGPWRFRADWTDGTTPPTRVRLQGALSILFWLGAVACGRLIAYF